MDLICLKILIEKKNALLSNSTHRLAFYAHCSRNTISTISSNLHPHTQLFRVRIKRIEIGVIIFDKRQQQQPRQRRRQQRQ